MQNFQSFNKWLSILTIFSLHYFQSQLRYLLLLITSILLSENIMFAPTHLIIHTRAIFMVFTSSVCWRNNHVVSAFLSVREVNHHSQFGQKRPLNKSHVYYVYGITIHELPSVLIMEYNKECITYLLHLMR